MTTYIIISWDGDTSLVTCYNYSEAVNRGYELYGGNVREIREH